MEYVSVTTLLLLWNSFLTILVVTYMVASKYARKRDLQELKDVQDQFFKELMDLVKVEERDLLHLDSQDPIQVEEYLKKKGVEDVSDKQQSK